MPTVNAYIPINHNGEGDFVSTKDWDDYVYGGIHACFDFTAAPVAKTKDAFVVNGSVAPLAKLHVYNGSAGFTPNALADEAFIEGDSTSTGLTIGGISGGGSNIYFGYATDPDAGRITYNYTSKYMELWANSTRMMSMQHLNPTFRIISYFDHNFGGSIHLMDNEQAQFGGGLNDTSGDALIFWSTTDNALHFQTIVGTPVDVVTMDNLGMINFKSVATGITASVIQAQGQQPLTSNINEISICANDDDAVTMPSVQAGAFVLVVNDGAKRLQLFPASGDNFEGVAANASIIMEKRSSTYAPSTSLFIGKDNDEWFKLNHIVTGYKGSGYADATLSMPIWGGEGRTELTESRRVDSNFGFWIAHTPTTAGTYLYFEDTAANDPVTIYITNNGQGGSGAHALVTCYVKGANSGDPHINFGIASTWWAAGVDNDQDDYFCINPGQKPGNATADSTFVLTTNGSLSIEKSNQGIYAYGLGGIGTYWSNTEYVRMYHSGSGAYINSSATGTGTTTPLYLQTGGVTGLIVQADQNINLPKNLLMDSDGAVIYFGDDQDMELTHIHNTGLSLNGFYRCASSSYRRYYHLSIDAFNPGASGATWVSADANHGNGYQLDAVGETLEGNVDIHSDWDGASDPKFEFTFTVNVDNSLGAAGDTVDIKIVLYYKGQGETATKTQTIEDAIVVGACAQWTQFKHEFTMDFDPGGGNDLEAGDVISFIINLETDTSEVDDITINDGSFYYNTTHSGIESGDT